MTSKKIGGSFNPNKDWKKTRCPELLMGKNSVKPWTIPKKMDWKISILMLL